MNILTAVGKTASAAVRVSNLITTGMNGHCILYMTAYGPTSEIRCLAQLLFEAQHMNFDDRRLNSPRPKDGTLYRIIPKLAHGFSALYLYPTGTKYIIKASREDCFNVFSRILDQQYFAHLDWYENLFAMHANEVIPLIGNKSCFLVPDTLTESIQKGVKSGDLPFPSPTQSLTIETKEATPCK